MQEIDAHADRARKNQLLALVLFGVSFGILGMMIAIVFLVRTGVLSRLFSHLGQIF